LSGLWIYQVSLRKVLKPSIREEIGGNLKYEILNRPAFSVLKIELDGDSVFSEPGAMMFIAGEIGVETTTGGIFKGLKRKILGGESLFLNKFEGIGEVWLAPKIPGDIRYLELKGDSVIVQDSSYLAHHGDLDYSVAWKGLRGLLAEGELFWIKLEGEGGVWVNSYGGMLEMELRHGEEIIVDNFHFVAMDGEMDYSIEKFGGLKSFLFGGEGIVARVRGPGRILLQTRTLSQFVEEIRRFLPREK